METTRTYTDKAEAYHRSRWRYAPEMAPALLERTGLGPEACVSDLGAGSGILTECFVGLVGRLIAVEPNDAMRAIAERSLARLPGVEVLPNTAEQTGLEDRSVDLIVAGHALHWFEPDAAREEFRRILRGGSILAIVTNRNTGPAANEVLAKVFAKLGRPDPTPMPGTGTPASFFFGASWPQEMRFPFVFRQDWARFLDSFHSMAAAPMPGEAGYPEFLDSVRAAFDELSCDGRVETRGETQVLFGRVADAG